MTEDKGWFPRGEDRGWQVGRMEPLATVTLEVGPTLAIQYATSWLTFLISFKVRLTRGITTLAEVI